MVSLATESMKKSNFLHQWETSTRYTFSLFLKGRCLEIIDPFLFDFKNSTAKVLYFVKQALVGASVMLAATLVSVYVPIFSRFCWLSICMSDAGL